MLTRPARRERSRRTAPRRTCRWRNERVCSRSSHTSIASTFVQAQQKTRIGAWVFQPSITTQQSRQLESAEKFARSIPAVIPLNRSASSASSSATAIGSGNKLDWIVSIKVMKRLPYTSPRLCSHPAADAKLALWAVRPKRNTSKRHPEHKVIRIFCVARRSTGRTKCGQLTSLTSPCDRGFVPGRDHIIHFICFSSSDLHR